jgi:acyl transferase domain-containing protein
MAGPLFVFPGAGSQWAGMGTALARSSPVFARRLRELRDLTDFSVTDAGDLGRIDVYQPALFAMAVALVEVWRSHGVEPAAVLGHSIGEFAAAHVSGALSLADASRIAVSWAQA